MKKIVHNEIIICIPFLMLAFSSCDNTNTQISEEKSTLQIKRFERDLFSLDLYSLADSIPWLLEKYPEFLPLFSIEVIHIGKPGTADYHNRLQAFISDFTNYQVSKHIDEVFPDLKIYEKELTEAFAKYREQFPGDVIPEIISCITGFNQSVITSDSLLAISLDKYLGSNDEFYRFLQPPVPDYMRKVMKPEKISPDAMLAWLLTMYEYRNEKDNLLGQMIYNGRAMYCAKQLMPQINDTLLWGYTNEQMDFCHKNERGMWEYLVEHKKLFLTDQFTLIQFINEAPFTSDFSHESPGRAAVWIGYNIVASYMERNREISLNELMKENDYQKILNLSKYNP
jgi:hypothetical protein